MRVLVQKWEETSRRWGNRPDGYSLHFGEESCMRYVTDVLQGPDGSFTHPAGPPYWAEISANDPRIERLNKNKGDCSFKGTDYPSTACTTEQDKIRAGRLRTVEISISLTWYQDGQEVVDCTTYRVHPQSFKMEQSRDARPIYAAGTGRIIDFHYNSAMDTKISGKMLRVK